MARNKKSFKKKTILKKDNILVFTTDFPPLVGGLATYTYGICQGLASFGIDVTVLAPFVHKEEFSSYHQLKFKIFRYPNLLILREILLLPYLTYLAIKFGITRVLCISWYPCGLIAMFNKWLLKTPYAVKFYGGDIFRKNVAKMKLRHKLKVKLFWLMKLIIDNAEEIFSNSNFTKQILAEIGVSQEKLKVVNPGIDAVKFSPAANIDLVMDKYNLKGKEIILTVARLEDYKGHDMVIKALKKVIEKVPNIVYLLVGQGPDEQRLRSLAASLGLTENLIFIKSISQEELIQLYTCSTIFIMVSREAGIEIEGFGIVFLEANACGRPVVAGRSGGIPDAVIDGQTGLLVEPKDTDAIADTMLRLILDKDYAQHLGKIGQNRARNYFGWDKVSKRIWEVMKDV